MVQAELVDWAAYAARWRALHGGYDPKTAALPIRGWLRLAYHTGRGLARLRFSPAVLTVLALVVSLFVPAVARQDGQWPLLAGGLVAAAAALDTVAGALAIVTRRVTRFGHVYAAVAARLAEAAWLVAFWAVGVPGALIGPTACLVFLHEYLRARATAAGLSGLAAVSLAERPARVVVSAVGLALAGACALVSPTLAAGAGTLAVAIWALLGLVGFIQLFAAVHRHLA